MTVSFCNGSKSFSFCDCMSFCNGSRRFSFCDCLSFFDRLSFRFCDCLLFEHSFSASVFNCMRFCDWFLSIRFRCPFLVAWVFSVRFQLHEVLWLLFIWAFVFGVHFWFNELLWLFLFERSNLVWWRLISATKGCISQCFLPFLHFGELKTAPSDPICLSMYVYRNEFDYLLKVFLLVFQVRTKD